MQAPSRPFVIVQGSREAFAAAVEEAERAGWVLHHGWDPPSFDDQRHVCVGEISGPDEASGALLAAVHGSGLVVLALAPPEVMERLAEDLRRIGPVSYRGDERAEPSARLDEEQELLLDLLASGTSVTDAARQLHISRRTAERRLATARTAFGCRTTAELVMANRRGSL